MVFLIIILVVANAPIGYYICKRFQIGQFWKIFFVGLIQYAVSAYLVSATIILTSDAKEPILEKIAGTFSLWIKSLVIMSVFVIPIILLIAWLFHSLFRKNHS